MSSTRDEALALCRLLTRQLEGCKLTAYQDTGGKWTIGYGHTPARPGQIISQETANFLLGEDLDTAANEVAKCVPEAQLTRILDNHELAALYDFAFNLGADPKWQIWKLLKAGDVNGARDQIPRFDHGMEGGKLVVIPGLEHRRTAEVIFWNTADFPAAVAVTTVPVAVPAPSSGYTRAIPTPPAPVPAPAGSTTSLAVKLGGGVAALGMGASQVHDIIAPHASEAAVFGTAAAVCTGVVIVAAVVGLLIHAEQAQARHT